MEACCRSHWSYLFYIHALTETMLRDSLSETSGKQACTGLHNKHWPAGFFSHRASDTQLLLAHTGHKVFVRATHCHIMLGRTIIQHLDLFPHCRDHFVRNATRLTHRSEFPCYVGDIQPFTVYPTIPLVLK